MVFFILFLISAAASGFPVFSSTTVCLMYGDQFSIISSSYSGFSPITDECILSLLPPNNGPPECAIFIFTLFDFSSVIFSATPSKPSIVNGTFCLFFVFLLNPAFTGDLDFFYKDKANSSVEISIDSVPVSGGLEIGSLTIASDGSETFKFNEGVDQDTVILPGSTMTIAAFAASGAGGDMQISLTWNEDII